MVFGFGEAGEADVKGGAFAKNAFCPDATAHGLYALFDQIKTQPRATDRAGGGVVDPVEFLENVGEVVGGDADARVGDVNEDFVAVATDVDPDVATFGGVFDGVADEVVHDFAEKADVE